MIDGDPTIVFGEHRRLALVLNGCKEAEFYLFEGEMTKADLAIEQFQESQLHQTFKPVEQATLLQQIMAEKGWTRAQLCEQMGIDESTISKLFRILENLDSSLHPDVDKGLLPFTCAYLIATVPEHAKQIELAERVKAGICTRTALGKRVKELLKKSPKARKPEPTTITCDDGLTVQLIGQKVEELLSALIALVERIKRAAKKEDALDILPVLLKRIA
jgi:ParB-like chromosome segregation protein Spo0J